MADKSVETTNMDDNMGAESLKGILNNTINTIESNKTQIFEIYETARNEVEISKRQLQELREQALATINRVDKLSKEEQVEKQRLVQVSSNFANYSEESIRASYEAVKHVQVALGVEREKEHSLREQRDKLELRLRQLKIMLQQAEHLAMAIGSVLSYLSSEVSGVVWRIEAIQKDKFVGARIIKAQEEERYRVSREIHDGPAQDLANLMFQTSVVEKLIDYDPEEARKGIQELRRDIRACLKNVRQVIFDMRPMALDDLGLVPALRQLVDRLAERGLLAAELSVDGNAYELPKHVEIVVFRIVQESLNNVIHHAGTTQAQVRMHYTASALSVLIVDKGKGFDVEALQQNKYKGTASMDEAKDIGQQAAESFNAAIKLQEKADSEAEAKAGAEAAAQADAAEAEDQAAHFGIVGMRERAKIIGGELNITSRPGEGTKVHLRIPNRMLKK